VIESFDEFTKMNEIKFPNFECLKKRVDKSLKLVHNRDLEPCPCSEEEKRTRTTSKKTSKKRNQRDKDSIQKDNKLAPLNKKRRK
jgi:hypothetical protein